MLGALLRQLVRLARQAARAARGAPSSVRLEGVLLAANVVLLGVGERAIAVGVRALQLARGTRSQRRGGTRACARCSGRKGRGAVSGCALAPGPPTS